MGVVISRLWTEKATPSVVELESRQHVVAAAGQAHNDAGAIMAEVTKLILQNQESQQKAMETAIHAIAAAQSQAHSEMMGMVQAQLAAMRAEAAVQSQAHFEMMAMVQAERTANEARLLAEAAARTVSEEVRQKAVEAEEERKHTLAIQAKKDVEAAMEQARKLEEAANTSKKEAEVAVEAAKEERMKAIAAQEAANMLKKEAEEEVKKANAAREKAEYKLKEAEEDIKKVNVAKEKAERKLEGCVQPVVTPTSEEFRAARKRIQYQENLFHCAIAGVAGAGKSSLINAFRGLRNGDTGSATTGVTETMLVLGRHANSNPQEPYVWYEIPDTGTLRIPGWRYFNTQGLYVFNCIIVMFDDRLTMTDIAILTNCRRFNIPTRIVRSKADQHIRNIMSCDMGYDSDDDENEDQKKKLYPVARQQFIEETRRIVKDNLDNANLPDQKVYIVSNEVMLGIAKEKRPKRVIDEIELWNDLFLCTRR